MPVVSDMAGMQATPARAGGRGRLRASSVASRTVCCGVMSWPAPSSRSVTRSEGPIEFRELTSVEDLRLMQAMEQRVWACEDLDVSPVLLLVALVKSGALALGAFIGADLKGFAFSVPGDRHGQRLHWSHMTGIDDDLRSGGLGTQLKFEQARRVAARGYRRIQWTYDPPAEPERPPQSREARGAGRRVRRARLRRLVE